MRVFMLYALVFDMRAAGNREQTQSQLMYV